MSCWVVPTVAADYWGVTLDVVWHRLCDGLIPHKTEQGFVFIDVDPWTIDPNGNTFHDRPCTFVAAGDELPPEDSALMDVADDAEDVEVADWVEPVPVDAPTDTWDADSEQEAFSDEETEPVLAIAADEEMNSEFENEDSQDDDDLPELDEEESATFGRLSWQDVRAKVSRTRRPPPSRPE